MPITDALFRPQVRVEVTARDPKCHLDALSAPSIESFQIVPGTNLGFSVDDTGLAYALPLDPFGTPYQEYALTVETEQVFYRTGDLTLAGTDVDVLTDPDVDVSTDLQTILLVLGADTHIAFRTDSGTAAVAIFAIER